MADLRPLRAFSIEKVRNLFRNARVALRDSRAPPEFVSEGRRFDAAYDCALACALLVLECNKVEMTGPGHHVEALKYLAKTLHLKGQTAAAIPAMVQARNNVRYDAVPLVNEQAVASAIAWAERVLAETEGWLQINQPLALK
jgi:hypothetical protein